MNEKAVSVVAYELAERVVVLVRDAYDGTPHPGIRDSDAEHALPYLVAGDVCLAFRESIERRERQLRMPRQAHEHCGPVRS